MSTSDSGTAPPRDALCGWLSLPSFVFGILIAVLGPFGASGGDASGIFEVLKAWAIGLAVCFAGFVFAIVGFFRRERPTWPAMLGFCLGLFPAMLGVAYLFAWANFRH